MLPTEKTRSKRLKVVRACSVCRRKKTKCNGEQPCTGCIKANVDCQYTASKSEQQQHPHQPAPPPLSRLTPISPAPTPPTPSTSSSSSSSVSCSSASSMPPSSSPPYIAAIEERLTMIEDTLRALLASRDPREPDYGRMVQHAHSGRPSSCANMYHPHPVHASHVLNRRSKRQRDEDDLPEVVQLPPIYSYHHPSEPSSTPAIRNLLNADDPVLTLKNAPSTVTRFYDAPSMGAAYPRISAAGASS